MKISEVWYISGAFFSDPKKDPEFAPHNFPETLFFAARKPTKKLQFRWESELFLILLFQVAVRTVIVPAAYNIFLISNLCVT